jgi:hypothetical protein
MDDLELRTRLWDTISEYVAACGGDTSKATVSSRRMNAVAAVERELHFLRTVDGAKTIAHFEEAVYGEGGVWPSWVYEARQAIKHARENIPWLDELIAALGWQGGTIYQALNCVHRLRAEADDSESGGATRETDEETSEPFWSCWGADWKDSNDMNARECLVLSPATFPEGTRILVIEPGPDSKTAMAFYRSLSLPAKLVGEPDGANYANAKQQERDK